MNQKSCDYEDRVLAANDEETARHVESCPYCADVLQVARWMKSIAAEKQDLVPLPDVDLIWIEARLRSIEKPQKTLLEGCAVALLVVCAAFGLREWAMSSAVMAGLSVIVLTLFVWPVVIEE